MGQADGFVSFTPSKLKVKKKKKKNGAHGKMLLNKRKDTSLPPLGARERDTTLKMQTSAGYKKNIGGLFSILNGRGEEMFSIKHEQTATG